jgi:hypothetical protein
MRRSTHSGLMSGLLIAVAVAPAHAQTAPASDAKSLLKKRVIHEKAFDRAELGEVLAYLREHYSVKVVIDQDAFKQAGLARPDKVLIDLPKLPGVPLELALELAVRQAGGTVHADADRIVIAPGKPRDYTSFLPPPGPAMREKMLKKTLIEKPISSAPLRDILEFLSDRYEMTILVDTSAFDKIRRGVLDTPCSSPAADTKLIEFLNYFAAQVEGKVLVRDEIILILPQTKKK